MAEYTIAANGTLIREQIGLAVQKEFYPEAGRVMLAAVGALDKDALRDQTVILKALFGDRRVIVDIEMIGAEILPPVANATGPLEDGGTASLRLRETGLDPELSRKLGDRPAGW
jgi:hypothetical protein